mgnify:CR=1 FL=1
MITNSSKNIPLAENTKHCTNAFTKCRGLMFTSPLRNKGLVFHFGKLQSISLHMFFVFYPIDVLWLNKDRQVVQMKKRFRPFTLIARSQPSCYVLELPSNTIDKTNTEIGDTIDF